MPKKAAYPEVVRTLAGGTATVSDNPDGLEKWLPNAGKRRHYMVKVFGTCVPGLTAYADVAPEKLSVVFCLTREEYEEYRIRRNDEPYARPTHWYDFHTFEPPNLSEELVVEDGKDYSDRPILARHPIPAGHMYWMEHAGYHLGPLHASDDVHLWESGDQVMTLIKKNVAGWIS